MSRKVWVMCLCGVVIVLVAEGLRRGLGLFLLAGWARPLGSCLQPESRYPSLEARQHPLAVPLGLVSLPSGWSADKETTWLSPRPLSVPCWDPPETTGRGRCQWLTPVESSGDAQEGRMPSQVGGSPTATSVGTPRTCKTSPGSSNASDPRSPAKHPQGVGNSVPVNRQPCRFHPTRTCHLQQRPPC